MTNKLKENTSKRENIFKQIDETLIDFAKEKSEATNTEKTDYFRDLDFACNLFNECYSNIQQGLHFHSQLTSYIERMVQVVNDFVMSRSLEREELVKILESNVQVQEEVKAPSESFLLPGYQEAESQVFFVPSCENMMQNFVGTFCTKFVNEYSEIKL
eukprot:TRINITY_DN3102_c0_g1_i5.p1 TRINITY_DN3102_c0_g1~~TRINITY_DN3102_c0_g1_i5.p1  ORF type:complete len:158 (+),score=56.26 TRINITY_DN3102_c0_g1_i5:306-779(+)